MCQMSAKQTPHTTTSAILPTSIRPNQSAGKDGKAVRLGNIREMGDAKAAKTLLCLVNPEIKIRKKHQQRRWDMFADQRTASQIWRSYNPLGKESKAAGKGVTACAWSIIATRTHADLMRVETKNGPRSYIEGLSKCDLRWVCPCCTRKHSEASRVQLNAALAQARKLGFISVMMTLTARHKKSDDLKKLWGQLMAADYKMKKSRKWKKLNKTLLRGFAKAVEITYGDNGWHPHFHIILMIDVRTEALAIEAVEDLKTEWLHQLNVAGLDGTSPAAEKRSFDVRGASATGEYITKWGAAEEMTLNTEKVGKSKGRNPWQLLRNARTNENEKERMKSGALWYEFIQVSKGVHQLQQNPEFRKLVKAYEPEEKDEPQPEPESLLRLYDTLWMGRGVYRHGLLLEAGEHADIEQAKIETFNVLYDDATDISTEKAEQDELVIEPF